MITVKDIREKEFGKQKNGYHEDEVDDFLDEIADQMEELIRENRNLLNQLEEAQSAAKAEPEQTYAPAASEAYAEPAQASGSIQPPVDEPSYFRNLEATLRETLLSAQRIADNTIAEARVKSKDLVSGAEEQARKITFEAKHAAESARTEFESLKKAHEDYKGRFLRMVKDQMAVINVDEDELKKGKDD